MTGFDDAEAAERRRLELLLRTETDGGLHAAEPEPYPGPGEADWSTGYHDPDHGLSLTAWYVADPAAREEAASSLEDANVRVATNGGLLLVIRAAGDEPDAARRQRKLITRFAGAE